MGQANYKCDGSKDNENASWGPDCSDGSDENLQMCCNAKSSYSKKCPGQTTTTTTTTKAASGSCTNKRGDSTCNAMKNWCTGRGFDEWMQQNCCKACSESASFERAEEVESVLANDGNNVSVVVGFFAYWCLLNFWSNCKIRFAQVSSRQLRRDRRRPGINVGWVDHQNIWITVNFSENDNLKGGARGMTLCTFC